MRLNQYGDYVAFDHEPTVEEIDEALEALIKKLSPYLKEAAIIKSVDGGPSIVTVGIKFFLFG